MDKEDMVCIMESYSALRKGEILPFVTTWMDFEGIMLIEKVRQRKTNIFFFKIYF